MLLKVGYRNLLRNKRRTLNILSTVALGTASLFLFHGFNAGVMGRYRDGTIKTRWGNGQINTKGYREVIHEKPWEHWIANPDEVATKLKQVPSIQHVFPRLEFFALVSNGKKDVAGRGQGIDGMEESKFFTNLSFVDGKNLTDEKDGIILGKGLADALKVKAGDNLTLLSNTIHGSLNGADVSVIGVFHTGLKEFDDSYFRVQLPVAQTILDTKSVEYMALGLDTYKNWDQVDKFTKENLPELDSTPFNIIDKVYYQHSVDWLQAQFRIFQFIIISVVILGIFNTVSTSVMERKQEIGNLRANGEASSDVLKLLLSEGLFMGLAGGILGILLGLIVAYGVLAGGITMPPAPGITRVFKVFIQLQPPMALQTFCMGLVACVLATALAGWGIVRQPIADLLRST